MSFLFKQVDNASLVFFRIVFGVLAFSETVALWTYHHLYKDYFNPDKFQFKYYGFEWIQPMAEPWMSIFFAIMLTASVLIILGKWYHQAMTVFAFSFAYTFFLEKALYLNHGYLFMWMSFLLIFLPLNRNFSGDVLKDKSIQRFTSPYWCLFLLQFLMGVVYFYGGIAKINSDWLLEAMPLKYWLSSKSDMFLLGPLWDLDATAWVMAWGGFLLDFTIVFFLLFRKTRIWAYAFAVLFHLTNTVIFKIGIFPWMSMALTALYFAPDFPRMGIAYFKERIKLVDKIHSWWINKTENAFEEQQTETAEKTETHGWRMNRKLVLAGLIPICCFHLLFPFRHHLLKGDVAWTEEGHRYSWRMMLRSKQGYGSFRIKDKLTGKEEVIRPKDFINPKQRRKLFTHPDMILQFAHYIRDKWKEEKGMNVEIYPSIKARLNKRDYQRYIHPTVDLAQEEWSFLHESEWILPMNKDAKIKMDD